MNRISNYIDNNNFDLTVVQDIESTTELSQLLSWSNSSIITDDHSNYLLDDNQVVFNNFNNLQKASIGPNENLSNVDLKYVDISNTFAYDLIIDGTPDPNKLPDGFNWIEQSNDKYAIFGRVMISLESINNTIHLKII